MSAVEADQDGPGKSFGCGTTDGKIALFFLSLHQLSNRSFNKRVYIQILQFMHVTREKNIANV